MPSTTSDETSCPTYGVTPNTGNPAALLPFQSAFWVDPADPAWPAGDKRWLPAYTSLPIYGAAPNKKITTVLTSWHGITAVANGHFCHVYGQYVAAENRQGNTLVVAPAFFQTPLLQQQWARTIPGYEPDAKSLFWVAGQSNTNNSERTWPNAGNSNTDPFDFALTGYTSSFNVMDAVHAYFLTGPGAALFPNVKLITHTHKQSAAGNMVQRWAWASTAGLADSPLPVHFAVLDPYLFTYFDARRPALSCSTLNNTGTSHKCGAFAVLSAGAVAACPAYDQWSYGVDVSAVGTPADGYSSFYLDAFKADPTLAAQRTTAYKCKQIKYVLAAADVCNCNTAGFANGAQCLKWTNQTCSPNAHGGYSCCDTYPDSTTSNALPVECGDMLGGSNRLQRALNFMSYLKVVYPRFKPNYVLTQNTGMTSWDIYGAFFCFFLFFCVSFVVSGWAAAAARSSCALSTPSPQKESTTLRATHTKKQHILLPTPFCLCARRSQTPNRHVGVQVVAYAGKGGKGGVKSANKAPSGATC